jgi:small conductance mechanosensitive channel
MNLEKINHYASLALDKIIKYSPSAISAILVLWIGFKIIKRIDKIVQTALEKSGLSSTIRPFISSIINIILKVTIILAAAGILGVDLGVFATIIGASVLAIGLSLQGSLGNLASGLLVLTLKPFKVEDWIDIEGKFGRVSEIGIFNTVIETPGKKTLIIPNSKTTSEVVTNYSKKGLIRLEINISMPYSESFPRVKEIIKNAIKPIDKILESPKPEIGIVGFDSHSIQIIVRPYTHPDNYWEVTFACYQNIKSAFSKHNIQVAYSEGVELGSIGE